jgi:hypothetical protein
MQAPCSVYPDDRRAAATAQQLIQLVQQWTKHPRDGMYTEPLHKVSKNHADHASILTACFLPPQWGAGPLALMQWLEWVI